MEEKEKAELIAQAENVEAITDFTKSWWTLDQLWETSAKATNTILYLINQHTLSHDDAKELADMMQQHMMMIDLIKPFARKEGEV